MIDHSINLLHNDYYLHVPRLNRKLQNNIVREWRSTKQLIKTMQSAGVQIKMLNPLGLFRQKAFYRDHKKLVAIDAENPALGTCYAGGINPSDHNASWNDFMVKMHGDITEFVYKELIRTWRGKSNAGIKKYADGDFITDARGEPYVIPYALQLIKKAKHRIVIESAYLWGKNLHSALVEAAERGVEVTVIVPGRNNKRVFILTKTALNKLSDSGAQVYMYQDHGGMTHAKAMLVDNTALFGSNNFSELLSGKISEANVSTKNVQLVRQLERFLKNDIARSVKQD
jgi:cardiolipin synthase